MNVRLHYEDIQRCELQALSKMDWDLFRVIPIDFLQTFELVHGFLMNSDLKHKEMKRLKRYRSSDQRYRPSFGQINDTAETIKNI